MSNLVLLATSILYFLTVSITFINAWYGQVGSEQLECRWRVTGPYWYTYWIMLMCPVLAPQVFWIKRLRKKAFVSLVILPFFWIGAIVERLIIMYTAGYRDYRPAAWAYYRPGLPEIAVPLVVFGIVLVTAYFLSRAMRRKRAA